MIIKLLVTDKKLSDELSAFIRNLGKEVVTEETITSVKPELVFADEHYADLVGKVKGTVVLCSSPLNVNCYQNRGFKTLLLPFDEWELSRILGHGKDSVSTLIGNSPSMQQLRKDIARYAPHNEPVHIRGESGTGKELAAAELRRLSGRPGLFIPVNCSAISENLLESELFGHEKGAFTGAVRKNVGLFQAANGGTLFLDEVGDMSASLQVKLLRVLQEGTVRPVGATESVAVDVRIITATHKSLADLVKSGEFREDLYYRLNILPISIPPLRERKDDIPALVGKFANGRGVTNGAMELLIQAQWRGNVRELQTVLKRALILSEPDEELTAELMLESLNLCSLTPITPTVSTPITPTVSDEVFNLSFTKVPTLGEVEDEYKKQMLARYPNATSVSMAKMMGVNRATVKRWGL